MLRLDANHLQPVLLKQWSDSLVLDKVLDKSDRNWRVTIVNIRNIRRGESIHAFVNQVKSVFDFLPVPVKIFWLLLVILHSEKTCILKVHEGNHLLVTIVHHKNSSQVVEIDFGQAALSGAVDTHGSQNLHFVVLLSHFGFDCL